MVITECPVLLKVLQKSNKTPQEIKSLRDAQCGVQGRNPKVCCPSNVCTTPDSQNGVCKNLYDCPTLLQLFSRPKPLPENVKQFLRQSACQGSATVNVCCGENNPTISSPTTPTPTYNVDDLLPANCGSTGDQDRIVGGNETAIDQYPWMALIEYRKRNNAISLSCAASVISKRYLLTAGHCVVGEVLTAVGTPLVITDF